jgi:uracil-DNA glycosylase
MISDLLKNTHPEWHDILTKALLEMDKSYLDELKFKTTYLPDQQVLLAAFKQPLSTMKYILFGESPYPRAISANGYAFWDGAVNSLWSDTGLSKLVNKSTSLRNLIKMLLYARGDLRTDFSQSAIAALDCKRYHQTLDGLFHKLLSQGFMLLNASLVYEENKIPYHARHWAVFMQVLLERLRDEKPDIKLILLGKIAEKIPGRTSFNCLVAEHPYNLSFMKNLDVINFFKPMDLLLHDNTKKYS